MAMALTLWEYLKEHDIDYDVRAHPHSGGSMETAAAAHVPGDQLAKSVVLEDEDGYVMAVLPSTCRLQLGMLHKQLHRTLGLATEAELEGLFKDCEIGAIPPIGRAYGMETIWDESLADCEDVYFEAGDHTGLVHLSGTEFRKLMEGLPHGRFSRHM